MRFEIPPTIVIMQTSKNIPKLLVAAVLMIAAQTYAQVTIGPETFNTASSTTADGWVASTNPAPSFGWSGSANAGGPAGELGGHIVMATNISSFAVPLGHTYDLTTNFSATGAFAITNSSPYG